MQERSRWMYWRKGVEKQTLNASKCHFWLIKPTAMKRMLLIWVALLMTSCGNAMASVPKRDQRQVPNQENNATEGELWAVLVAGSSGWFNYRHQADICHAYQILRKHGVPDDHIIVMMYDDIAYNEENPDPGVIINRPDGPNVYEGILKDYIGEDVTPQNFLNVLKGNSSAMAGIGSGKVVKSSKNDRIFINLVDHGAPGIFAFPGSYLHARTLVNTVLKLHQQRKFEQMVIYVEACESGSMFSNLLPDDVQIYALSASNPHEPSYACYMDENLQTYLGDVFSVKWMEDTDRENIHHETLRHQFKLVRREVTTSTVMEWGEFDVNKQKLDEFMGEKNHSYLNSVLHPSDDPENHQELSKVLKFDAEIEKKTDDFMGKKDHRYRNSIRYPNDNLENHQVLPEVLESDAEIKKKMRDDDCLVRYGYMIAFCVLEFILLSGSFSQASCLWVKYSVVFPYKLCYLSLSNFGGSNELIQLHFLHILEQEQEELIYISSITPLTRDNVTLTSHPTSRGTAVLQIIISNRIATELMCTCAHTHTQL
ncbi:hypothetical protein SK128_008480 [Halocaridina rubra]|uniref:legumain n=1 Tax=Halocaridina rubra TaxID=373956 RepID=A0AAN8WV57_HALRR